MGVPAGPWYIDDTLTFTAITHRFDTGALTDADAVPAYRIYEDETGTAILTGNTAKLDDASTTGFYSEQITLSAANGFEAGKSYSIYVTAAVNSVTGGQTFNFKVINEPLRPTTAGRTLDVSAGGEAGVDWANVGGQTTTVNLTNTSISETGAITGFAGEVRLAIGMAGAGTYDTDIASLATASALATAQTSIDDLPTATENADALLGRNVSGGSSAGRTVKQALHFLRNKWDIAAGTLTVYDTDDSTSSWTASVTTDAAANPIITNDPA
jgi:hypothetical protein